MRHDMAAVAVVSRAGVSVGFCVGPRHGLFHHGLGMSRMRESLTVILESLTVDMALPPMTRGRTCRRDAGRLTNIRVDRGLAVHEGRSDVAREDEERDQRSGEGGVPTHTGTIPTRGPSFDPDRRHESRHPPASAQETNPVWTANEPEAKPRR